MRKQVLLSRRAYADWFGPDAGQQKQWLSGSERSKEEGMSDLREYSFRDWFALFLKAVPAFLLALLIVLILPAILSAVVWFFLR
jgi:hypothetical protein